MSEDIKIKIGGDATGFANSLKSVKAQAAGAGKIVASGLSGMMGPLAGIASIAGVTKVLTDVAKKGDAIADGSKRIGVTAEEYQKMSFAAERSGASIENVEASVKKMSKVIYDASTGSESAAQALAALGLTIDDLKGKSPEEQFARIAQALNAVQDSTTKAALAQEIFGKGGTALIPMLGDYEALKAELEAIGGVMSNDAVAAADQLSDSITSLKAAFTALVADSGVIKWLAGVTEGMSAVYSNAKRMESMGATGDYGKGGFFQNLKDGWFGESEGSKVRASSTAQDFAGKQQEMARAPSAMDKLTERGAILEEQLRNQRAQASNLNIPEEMRAKAQQNVNELLVEYKKLLGEAAGLGDLEAKAAIGRIDAEIKSAAALDKFIRQMQYKVELQKDANSLTEDEAKIKQALLDAEKAAGRELSGKEKGRVADLAKQQIDGENEQTGIDAAKNVQDMIAGMEEELYMQDLINSGREKQAAIDKALADAKKTAKGGLTKDEQDKITELAGGLFDSKSGGKSMEGPEFQGSLAKMGAYFGPSAAPADPQKKANEMLGGIRDLMKEVAENTEFGKEYI